MYKLIQNDQVIDVVKYPCFVSFLPSGHIAITDKTSAHGIVGSDNKTIYSFETQPNYPVVIIKEITHDELERLQGLLSSGQKPAVDDAALAAARNATIKELSVICKYKITVGFSVVLSDNNVYGFRLTTEDQLNLMSIEGQLNAGVNTFVYHATNSPCQVFSREDMTKILNAFKRHILYHTTYFNVAKQYINSLLDIEVIKTFAYGTDISDTADDPIIKQILKNGGSLS
jgi:hypothetical protein